MRSERSVVQRYAAWRVRTAYGRSVVMMLLFGPFLIFSVAVGRGSGTWGYDVLLVLGGTTLTFLWWLGPYWWWTRDERKGRRTAGFHSYRFPWDA